MKTIKGPAIFLAQFIDDKAPFNSLEGLCKWASDLGYKGIQVPTLDSWLFDLDKASDSQAYCDEFKGKVNSYGLEITELSTHIQGQLVAVHPAYDLMFDNFAPEAVRNNPTARTEWAPILDVFDENGVDACYEIHPGEDLHDGETFERFLAATNNHPRAAILYDPSHFVLQQLDYITYIDHYHEYIKAFHVKDSEFIPNGKKGAFGGFNTWKNRAGRYRSPGDGQIDFKSIFTKLTEYGCDVWAVMEWECVIKSPEQGAIEGAEFIQKHIIEATEKTFDDFASSTVDEATNRKILGL
jgi:sugar phosphate isomerase/epimerase